MKREALIIKFIKDNLKILQHKEPFPYEPYKAVKHSYFFENEEIRDVVKKKPKDSEIAEIALLYLIRKRIVKTESELQRMTNLPFFQDNLYDTTKILEALNSNDPNSSDILIDPSRIVQADYQEKIKEQIEQNLLDRNKEVFDEQKRLFNQEMEAMKKEAATITTKLESQEFEEPKVKKEESILHQEWWQILNLRADPFPASEGLQKIDKTIYEQIIVLTDIFKRFVHYCERQRDQLFKNTIFYGEFGSGKTAFFDYFMEILLRNKVLPVKVALWPALDVDINIRNFEEKLTNRLRDLCSKLNLLPDETQADIRIIELLSLAKQKGFVGLIIMVDDLHKNRDQKAFKAVRDFISYLQIFTSELITDSGMDVGLYLAGLPAWKERISTDSGLSGSLIRDESFKDITESNAYEMLNKRLLAYSINTNRKNIIGPSFVKQVYEDLVEKKQPVTFRAFLQKTLEELSDNKNYDILTVNPKAIPQSTLNVIKQLILSQSTHYKFEDLLERLSKRNPVNLQNCLSLLGIVFLEGGIVENSELFQRNLWALQQLKRSGLISYSDLNGSWNVSKDLRDINDQIMLQYSVSMEDYLIPMFSGNKVQRVQVSYDIPEMNVLSEIRKRAKDIEKPIISDVMATHKKLHMIDRTHDVNIVPEDLVQQCVRSLAGITRLFFLLSNLSIDSKRNTELLKFWKSFWYRPSSLIEFINQTIDDDKKPDITSANFIFGLYKESFVTLVSFYKNQFDKSSSFGIECEDLTADDAMKFHIARESWSDRNYYEGASIIAEHLEKKLRETIYNVFSLLYGTYEKRIKRVDKEIRKRAFITNEENNKNTNEAKDIKKEFSKAVNELQYLDRKDYLQLMTKDDRSPLGHQNWEEIFKYIFYPWEEDKMRTFLGLFADFNTAVSHNKNEVITIQQQNKLLQFISGAMFFVRALNKTYRILLINSIYELEKKFFFSFHSFQDRPCLTEVYPIREEVVRLVRSMSNMEEINVPFNRPDIVESSFNIEYRKCFAIISRLLKVDDVEYSKASIRLSIIEDRTPEFQFKLEQKEDIK